MKASYLKWYAVAAALVFGPVGVRMLCWQRTKPLPVDREIAQSGAELFNHTWQVHDSLSPDGDGIGPVFNARSCVACHNQGGPGGGGDLEHNVTTYVIGPVNGVGETREGVIHSHATDEKNRETLHHLDPTLPAISQISLERLLSKGDPLDNRPIPVGKKFIPNGDDVPLVLPNHIKLSQRNTPALFGSNLIDAIPERVILANERAQRLKHGIGDRHALNLQVRRGGFPLAPVGRVHRLPDGSIGRFGWKAQTAHLEDFVQAACANELGLGNPNKAQPISLANANYRSPGLDLTQKQCDQLTAYVASLSRPVEKLPTETARQKQAHLGKALFGKIGCAECHTPDLGSVEGLYSDLLLHSMGDGLQGAGRGYNGEPSPARPDKSRPTESGPLADEWRTPPLWGVVDSAPYLHDGRAATLEQAIEMHDGQAATSALNFKILRQAEKTQLLAFLQTLRAPDR